MQKLSGIWAAARSVRPFRLTAFARRMLRDTTAGTTTFVALAAPVIIGALGIGVDTSAWYMEKRKLQQMADSAALAGARVKAANQPGTVVVNVATNDAKRNGYSATTHTLAINNPPTSGPNMESDGAVEAIVTTQLKTLFAGFTIGGDPRTLSARSVAAVKVMTDAEIRKTVCMLSLATSGQKAIFMNGSGTVTAKDCSMAAHSTDSKALYLNGSGTIKGFTAMLKGNLYVNGSGGYVFTAPAATYQTKVVEDPHADLVIDGMPLTCTSENYVASGSATIQPGRYCGGILNSGSGTLTLAPGTYYIDGGNVENSGSGSIVCGDCSGDLGVTLVFTSGLSTGTNIGGLFSNGSGKIVLPAPGPTSGQPYVGVVVFQDRRASAAIEEFGVALSGGGGDRLSGAVYTPKRTVHLNGSGMIGENGKACLSIVALKIEMIGSGTIETTDCGSMGTVVAMPKTVALLLVE